MGKHSDKKLIYAALIGNSAMAMMKFMVEVSIFFVGATLSIYEGINKTLHPEPVRSLVPPQRPAENTTC